MRPFRSDNGRIYALEPLSGGWAFLQRTEDSSILVLKAALSDQEGQKHFHVPSVVSADSDWGRRGADGYFSLGYLVDTPLSPRHALVSCVRADQVIPEGTTVDFVKLDPLGGARWPQSKV